jgi:hypothetical protein
MVCKYRLVSDGAAGSDEGWYDELAAAEGETAKRLGLAEADVENRRVTINLDPIVVRHDGARWRSRRTWRYRGDAASPEAAGVRVQVHEMVRIEEAQYDH